MNKKPTYKDLEQRIKVLEEAVIESERRHVALKQNEEKFRILADLAPAAIMLYQDGHWVYVNQATENIAGYSKSELFRMNYLDIIHPDFQLLIKIYGQKFKRGEEATYSDVVKIIKQDGSEKWVSLRGVSTMIGDQPAGVVSVADITDQKRAEEEREKLISELRQALSEVKALSGLLPICASCKKIRDDKGYWSQIESYISDHSEAQFSHGICPDCMKKLYPDVHAKKMQKVDKS